MMKKIMVCMLSICLLTTACKKDDAAPTPNYTNLLVGKWSYINQIGLTTAPNGSTSKDTLKYNNGSYFDFKATNKFSVYVNDKGRITRDSGIYSLAGNQLYMNLYTGLKDTGTILTIDTANLTLYSKSTPAPGYTMEVWNNFKK